MGIRVALYGTFSTVSYFSLSYLGVWDFVANLTVDRSKELLSAARVSASQGSVGSIAQGGTSVATSASAASLAAQPAAVAPPPTLEPVAVVATPAANSGGRTWVQYLYGAQKSQGTATSS